jgi:hypothetical protein
MGGLPAGKGGRGIQRASDIKEAFTGYVGVAFGGPQSAVAQKILNIPDVNAVFE